MIKFLEQIFCDGSIVQYIERKPHILGVGERVLTRTDADGSRHSTTVSAGYLQSKVDLMRHTGNGHKILRAY
jgi:hypothetical protein